MNVPKMLKQWRGVTKAKPRGGFSQAEASTRLGVNLRTYQQWECGRRAPRGLALAALAERIK
jgi:DNA-binding transcriptional regulator YiaG